MTWQLKIDCGNQDTQIVCSHLWDLNTNGIFISDESIIAGFSSEEEALHAQKNIEVTSELRFVEDWSQPSFSKLEVQVSNRKLEIELETNKVFGHGYHPTTALTIKLLTATIDSKKINTVLDVGTGSGVLAIIAGKMGSVVTATDNDPVAVATAKRNCELNNVQNVTITSNTLPDIKQKYELVVANLLLPIHLKLGEAIQSKLETDGILIISGLLENQSQQVEQIYSNLKLTDNVTQDGWTAMKFVKT